MKKAIVLPAALLAPLLAAASAIAGDAASLNVLGFSADGKLFAFEEYGVQDGSGFPYTNRFYVDTATDTFVPGSPVRVRLDDEAATVDAARSQAAAQGEAVVPSALLAANPGYLAGFNPVTELSADAFAIKVNPRPVDPPIDAPLELRLEEFALAPRAGQCDGIDGVKGFRLTRIAGDAQALLAEDASVPASRNCPTGYRIGGVQTFFPSGGEPVYAVLVSVRSFGFEGPDYRWLAVTGRLQ